MDLLPVPEHPQLLQRLYLLERARRPVHITLDETGAIGVDADVTLVVIANLLAACGKTITIPRNGGTAEVEGVAILVGHHLDGVRVERLFGVPDRHRQGRHGRAGSGQVVRHLTDDDRRNERLVPLHVDHYGVGGKTIVTAHLGQPLGTGLVILRGHAHFEPGGQQSLLHPLIVGGDDHPIGARLQGLFHHVLYHGLAMDVGQRLARQPGGGVAGRNDDDEAHDDSSSLLSGRARFSSSTGIPSSSG